MLNPLDKSVDESSLVPKLNWIQKIPKAELHAHLSGSISSLFLTSLIKKKLQVDPHNTLLRTYLNKKSWILQLPENPDDLTIENRKSFLDDCFRIFDVIHAVITTHDDLFQSTLSVLEDFYKDGVYYLELRTTPKSLDGKPLSKYISTVLEAIKHFEVECTKNSNSIPMVCRLILSINREKHNVNQAWEIVKLGRNYKNETSNPNSKLYFPGGGVLGIDISGNPTKCDSLKRFSPHFKFCKEQNLMLTIHFAEVYSPKECHWVLDDVKPERIGHANFLDSSLFKKLILSNVPIEMCPTSNVLTSSVSSYSNHHFNKFFKAHHPIAISTDDQGAFLTSLSKEYWYMANSFSLHPHNIIFLARSSFHLSFFAKSDPNAFANWFKQLPFPKV